MGSDLGTLSAARPDPQFTRHLDGLFPTLEQLVQASEDAHALLSTPGWRVLRAVLEAEVATIDAELDRDRPLETRADYAAKHGRRGGLRAPETALLALIHRAETRLEQQRAKHERDAEPSLERTG